MDNQDIRFAPTESDSFVSSVAIDTQRIDKAFLNFSSPLGFSVVEDKDDRKVTTQSKLFRCERAGREYVMQVFLSPGSEIAKDTLKKLGSIKSQHLQSFLEIGRHQGYLYIVTEYFQDGDLASCLNDKRLTDDVINKYLIPQINEALRSLHELDIVHRDVKTSNILVDFSQNRFVLSDFGISKVLNGASYLLSDDKAGTSAFAAPNSDKYIMKENDYYSMGHVIYHAALHRDPTIGLSKEMSFAMNDQGLIKVMQNIDPDLRNLISALLEPDAKNRARYDDVEKWLKNPEFLANRFLNFSTIADTYQLKQAIPFDNRAFLSLRDLTESWSDNWSLVKFDYQEINGEGLPKLFESLFKQMAPKDRILFTRRLDEIKKQYENDIDTQLLAVFMHLNPIKKFNYAGYNFGNLKGYVKHISNNGQSIESIPYVETILKEFLRREISNDKNYELEPFFANLFRSSLSNESKKSIIHSTFKSYSGDSSFILDGHHFKNIEDFAKILFDEEGLPFDLPSIATPFFKYILVDRFSLDSDKVSEILKIEDLFERYAALSKLLVGRIDISRGEGDKYKFWYFDDFINAAKQEYLKSEKDRDLFIARFIKSGLMSKFVTCFFDKESETKSELLNFIHSLEVETNLNNLLSKFYFYSSKEKQFVYEGQSFSSVQQMIDFLAESPNIEEVSKKIILSDDFYLWLRAKGFPEQEIKK